MARNEIEAVRAILSSKPRPTHWSERRQRLDEVGSVWATAPDVTLEAIHVGGFAAEWSLAPGSDPSRVLLFFTGEAIAPGPF